MLQASDGPSSTPPPSASTSTFSKPQSVRSNRPLGSGIKTVVTSPRTYQTDERGASSQLTSLLSSCSLGKGRATVSRRRSTSSFRPQRARYRQFLRASSVRCDVLSLVPTRRQYHGSIAMVGIRATSSRGPCSTSFGSEQPATRLCARPFLVRRLADRKLESAIRRPRLSCQRQGRRRCRQRAET